MSAPAPSFLPTPPSRRRLPSTGARFVEPCMASTLSPENDSLSAYRFRALDYVRDKLRMRVWRGVTGCVCSGRDAHSHPGQAEVLEALDYSMQQQRELQMLRRGEIDASALRYYQPGAPIKNEIQIPGGNGTGKSIVAAAAANYFFDVFTPCVVTIVAPKAEQAKEQIFQDIKDLRRGKGLPGEMMDRIIRSVRMLDADDTSGAKHFVRIATASMEGGKAGERLQGMHSPYQLIIMDESEGIHASFLAPLQSWLSGGQGVILELANPRTRTSWYHKRRDAPTVRRMTLSSLFHPNVLNDSDEYPGAVTRSYLDGLLAGCEIVASHDSSLGTVDVPWYKGGAIVVPDDAFSFRGLGEAPATVSYRTFFTPAVFDSARKRGEDLYAIAS